MIRVVLVDDHNALRQSMGAAIGEDKGFHVVGSFSGVEEAKRAIPGLKPDIILADIVLPGATGIELAAWVHKKHSSVRVVMFTMHDNEEYVRAALQAGAIGYVLKDSFLPDVITALRSAARNQTYFSPAISKIVNSGPRRWYGNSKKAFGTDMLTAKEKEVLKMIADGLRIKETALKLDISVRTAETHRKNIMAKLDIHTSIELARYAIKSGLL